MEVVAQTCGSRMWNQSDTSHSRQFGGTSHSLPKCSRGTPTSNTLSAFLISVLSLPLCSWALQQKPHQIKVDKLQAKALQV